MGRIFEQHKEQEITDQVIGITFCYSRPPSLNCKENADTQIVREALDVACRKENVTVVAEDRHFSAAIVLLEHRNRRNFHDIRTKKEAGKKTYQCAEGGRKLELQCYKKLTIHTCM